MLDALNKLAANLYMQYPTVNRGGCCVVAAQVGKHLAKIVPIKISVEGDRYVYFRFSIKRVREQTNNSLDKNQWNMFMNFPHVVVEFKYKNTWYTFDAERGVVKSKVYWRHTTKKTGSLSLKEATAFADDDGWNPIFDRGNVQSLRWRITRFFNRNVI